MAATTTTEASAPHMQAPPALRFDLSLDETATFMGSFELRDGSTKGARKWQSVYTYFIYICATWAG